MKYRSFLGALLLSAAAAQAQTTTEGTTIFPNGQSFDTTVTTTRDGNTRTTTSTGLGSDGRGYDRTAVWTWDPATKSWNKSVVGQTANGRTWTNTGGGACAAGRCASSSTFVGPRGETSVRNSQTLRENGVTHRRSERTNRRGKTVRDWKRVR